MKWLVCVVNKIVDFEFVGFVVYVCMMVVMVVGVVVMCVIVIE